MEVHLWLGRLTGIPIPELQLDLDLHIVLTTHGWLLHCSRRFTARMPYLHLLAVQVLRGRRLFLLDSISLLPITGQPMSPVPSLPDSIPPAPLPSPNPTLKKCKQELNKIAPTPPTGIPPAPFLMPKRFYSMMPMDLGRCSSRRATRRRCDQPRRHFSELIEPPMIDCFGLYHLNMMTLLGAHCSGSTTCGITLLLWQYVFHAHSVFLDL